jgi:hypothetical protein
VFQSRDRLNKIMGAYTDDRVFSIDLVGAVSRLFASIVTRRLMGLFRSSDKPRL